MKKMTDEQRAKMEAFAKQMGHTRPAGGPVAVAASGGAAKSQQNAENAAKTEAEMRKKLPNKLENAFMLDLMLLKAGLSKRRAAVRERLEEAGYRNAWRDLQLLYTLTCRIQNALYETMPKKRQEYYDWMGAYTKYHIAVEGPLPNHGKVVPISDRNLGAILDECVEHTCLLCLKDGREIEACPIREALLEVGPPKEVHEDPGRFGCEYRNMAGQVVRGEEIDV